jgi:hypothetical protein
MEKKNMTLFEDPFRNGARQQGQPRPLMIDLADSDTVAIGLATLSGSINGIRIQDVARQIWYSWDKNSTYPNGSWDNAGGTAGNAPVGQTPLITPGNGNLLISFNAVNNGSVTGNLTLTIKDGAGNTLANQTIQTPAGGNAGLSVTVNMPATAYSITFSVTP